MDPYRKLCNASSSFANDSKIVFSFVTMRMLSIRLETFSNRRVPPARLSV
jgi:hypothetical protein